MHPPFFCRRFENTRMPFWYEISYIPGVHLGLDNVRFDLREPLFGGPVNISRLLLKNFGQLELNPTTLSYVLLDLGDMYVTNRDCTLKKARLEASHFLWHTFSWCLSSPLFLFPSHTYLLLTVAHDTNHRSQSH